MKLHQGKLVVHGKAHDDAGFGGLILFSGIVSTKDTFFFDLCH